ncbi:MAG: metalloregulator ArsR/SmtB family transcription factor [Thermoproteota archaeon]
MPRKVIPVRLEEAKALSDELRIMILELLREEPLSVIEIVEKLRARGIVKTPNAVRYHLSILKDAGLIELVRVGRVLKYHAKDAYYAYTTQDPAVDEMLEELAELVEREVEAAVNKLLAERREDIVRLARSMKPCEFCITRHFVEHIVFEAVKRAAGRVLSKKFQKGSHEAHSHSS